MKTHARVDFSHVRQADTQEVSRWHASRVVKIFKSTLRRCDTRPAHRLCPGRAVDSEQLILKGRNTLELLVNTVSQRQHIVVTRADDDACMR